MWWQRHLYQNILFWKQMSNFGVLLWQSDFTFVTVKHVIFPLDCHSWHIFALVSLHLHISTQNFAKFHFFISVTIPSMPSKYLKLATAPYIIWVKFWISIFSYVKTPIVSSGFRLSICWKNIMTNTVIWQEQLFINLVEGKTKIWLIRVDWFRPEAGNKWCDWVR